MKTSRLWGLVFSGLIAILYVYLRQLMFKGKT